MKFKIIAFTLSFILNAKSADIDKRYVFDNLKVICSAILETGAQIDICENGDIVYYPRHFPLVQNKKTSEEKKALLNQLRYKIDCPPLSTPVTINNIQPFIKKSYIKIEVSNLSQTHIVYHVFPSEEIYTPYGHSQEIYQQYLKNYTKYGL